MHNLTTAALAAVIAVSCAGSAAAFSFSPASARFTVTGTVFLGSHGRQQQCAAKFTGVTGKSGSATARIKAVSLTGSGACATATNLPWILTATGAGTASIANLAYVGGTGQCGPSAEPLAIDPQGIWSIRATDLRGGCSLIASGLVSTPPITIAP